MKFFKEVSEIKKYLPVANAFEKEQIEPFVAIDAEEQQLKKLLGETLMASLLVQYNATPAAPWTDLITKVQAYLANHGYLKYLPFALTNQTNGTINVSFSDKSKPAAEWQIDKLEEILLERRDSAEEDLLAFLEADVRNANVFGAAWATSEGYSITNTSFLQTALLFDAAYPIGKSRRTYLAFRAFMKSVEEGPLQKILTPAFYISLKGKIAADSFTANEKIILPLIKGAIAYLTVAKSCPHLAVKVNSDGVQINSLSELSVRKVKQPAGKDEKADLIAACTEQGMNFLNELDKYLKEHYADFPLYPQVPVVADDAKFKIINVGGISGF